MANRHFASLADMWKHLVLVEVLSIERPSRYWESHAGSATYEMVDDTERSYGVRRFLKVARRFPALALNRPGFCRGSAYWVPASAAGMV